MCNVISCKAFIDYFIITVTSFHFLAFLASRPVEKT